MITITGIVIGVVLAFIGVWLWFLRDAYRNSERGKADRERKQ